MLMTIIFIFAIKFEIGNSMDLRRESNIHQQQIGGMLARNFEAGGSSSGGRGQERRRPMKGWEKVFRAHQNSHIDPPIGELAEILAFFDWMANNGNEIFDAANIVENPAEILGKMIGYLPEEIIKFAENFREFIPELMENGQQNEPKRLRLDQRGNFMKIKYPNTRALLFQRMLMGAINEVKIPQSEIDAPLKKGEEEENKRRIRQKYEFQFGFIMDCLFAHYMGIGQKIDYRRILEKLKMIDERLRGPLANEDEEMDMAKRHPFRGILLQNKCADRESVDAFMQTIMATNLQEYDFEVLAPDLEQFFMEIIGEKFVKTMIKNKKLEEEYSALKLNPYFPEELPKIANLGALASVLIRTIWHIIELIKPQNYANKWPKMKEILEKTIRNVSKKKTLMHFVVTHGKHYKNGMKKVVYLGNNMAKLGADDSIFTLILDEIHYFGYWFEKLKMQMVKYVAEAYFGLAIQQRMDEDSHFGNYFEPIVKQIAQHIVQKYLNLLRNAEDERTLNADQMRTEEQKKKLRLLQFLHLRIFCIWIRQQKKEERKFIRRNWEFKNIKEKLDLLEFVRPIKEIMEGEIMPILEADGFLNDFEGFQFVDMDAFFKKGFPMIRDRICRLK